jgi:copper chaperone CopZ
MSFQFLRAFNNGTLFRVSKFITLFLVIFLSSMPEMVRLVNESAKTHQKSLILSISTLKCESCANRVKNVLKSLLFVADCQVFLANSTAVVFLRHDTKINPDVIHSLTEALLSNGHFESVVVKNLAELGLNSAKATELRSEL